MSTLPITVLIAAKNEEINLGRCLAAALTAERLVVIDSHSTDRTAEIAETAGAEVVQFDYHGGYPKKRQWALDTLAIQTPWVLLLDADEVVPTALWREIKAALSDPRAPEAFLITKGYHFLGRRFRFGGFSHNAVLLVQTGRARFEQMIDEPDSALDMEVHERLLIDGRIGKLRTPLVHDDFKGIAAYLDRHNSYSTWEARIRHRLRTTGTWGERTIRPALFGNVQECRRFLKSIAIRIPGEPLLWFAYHYIFRLGFLEGRAGLIASQIRSAYISQVRAKLYELRCDRRSDCLSKARFSPSNTDRANGRLRNAA